LKVGGKLVSETEERTRLMVREVERFAAQWRTMLTSSRVIAV
jgi:hypothetical protein